MVEETTWTNVLDKEIKPYQTLDCITKLLYKKYGTRINKIVNTYMFNGWTNETELYLKMRPIIIDINNQINGNIADKFKGSYNYCYTDYGFKISETEWCSEDKIEDIWLNCRKCFSLSKGKDFGKYFFTAVRNFTGNIANSLKYSVNKSRQTEVSLNDDKMTGIIEQAIIKYDEANPIDIKLSLNNFIDTLAADDKTFIGYIIMPFYTGMKYKDESLAKMFSCSTKTIKRRREKLFKQLSKSLEE